MSVSPPPIKRRRTGLSSESGITTTEEHALSIYSWNINGIDALLQPPISSFFGNGTTSEKQAPSSPLQKPLSPLQTVLARHKWPHLYFLQEVKIRPGDEACMKLVRKAVSASGRVDIPGYVAHFCLPDRKRPSRAPGAKVYGVCTLIRKDFAPEIIQTETVDWDKEGRFLLSLIRETASRPKLAVFNAYMVNGTTLPYKNYATGEVLGTRHDRKLEVHKLLQAHCRRLEQDGYAVIIAGDINIARSASDGFPNLRTFPIQHVLNRSDFEGRFLASAKGQPLRDKPAQAPPLESIGMIDTYRILHPGKRGYSYYTRSVPFGESCDRVDMVLASDSLKRHLAVAGMHETELDRGPSDHVPIYAKFDFEPAEHAQSIQLSDPDSSFAGVDGQGGQISISRLG